MGHNTPSTKAPPGPGNQGPVENIAIATATLAEAVAAKDEAKLSHALDTLTSCFADKPWLSVPVETLVVSWTSCGDVLDAGFGPEVRVFSKPCAVLSSK